MDIEVHRVVLLEGHWRYYRRHPGQTPPPAARPLLPQRTTTCFLPPVALIISLVASPTSARGAAPATNTHAAPSNSTFSPQLRSIRSPARNCMLLPQAAPPHTTPARAAHPRSAQLSSAWPSTPPHSSTRQAISAPPAASAHASAAPARASPDSAPHAPDLPLLRLHQASPPLAPAPRTRRPSHRSTLLSATRPTAPRSTLLRPLPRASPILQRRCHRSIPCAPQLRRKPRPRSPPARFQFAHAKSLENPLTARHTGACPCRCRRSREGKPAAAEAPPGDKNATTLLSLASSLSSHSPWLSSLSLHARRANPSFGHRLAPPFCTTPRLAELSLHVDAPFLGRPQSGQSSPPSPPPVTAVAVDSGGPGPRRRLHPAPEQVPETMKIDNDATPYLSIGEQVKHGFSEDPYRFVRDKGKP
nr:vegetative cell wall protein gp1-like [Lolium perenne]